MSGLNSMPADALKVGDTIEVWWGIKRATVLGFRPHNSGKDGWRVVDFADGFSMTLTPICVERVLLISDGAEDEQKRNTS